MQRDDQQGFRIATWEEKKKKHDGGLTYGISGVLKVPMRLNDILWYGVTAKIQEAQMKHAHGRALSTIDQRTSLAEFSAVVLAYPRGGELKVLQGSLVVLFHMTAFEVHVAEMSECIWEDGRGLAEVLVGQLITGLNWMNAPSTTLNAKAF